MVIIDSLLITLGMYTIIPVPQQAWTERGMRWTMAWFPLLGIIVSLGWLLLLWLNSLLLSPVFYLLAVLMTLWPIILTGGLHIDGLADTADALGSRRDRDSKLRIMKDPTSGPSAILWTASILLLQIMAWLELIHSDLKSAPDKLLIVLLIPVISRILSALGVAALPPARSNGLVKTFRDGLAPAVKHILILTAGIIGVLCLFLDLLSGLIVIAAALICFFLWSLMCRHGFGGVTGDLAGFLQIVSETILLVILAVLHNQIS